MRGDSMKCVKCGQTITPVDQTWYQFGQPTTVAKRRYCIGTKCNSLVKPAAGEHLDVTCGVCGYTWAEPCADARAGTFVSDTTSVVAFRAVDTVETAKILDANVVTAKIVDTASREVKGGSKK